MKQNLVGQRFEKLVVVEHVDNTFCKCVCDCGKEKITRKYNLLNGSTRSCGCLRSHSKKKHGLPRGRLYFIWANMRQRCRNQKHRDFKNYGGRGITVSPEWDSYEAFYNWSHQNGYSAELSLDRIDNDAGYSPDNCRWADRKTQGNNRRTNIRTELDGEMLTLMQIAEKSGQSYSTVSRRYWNGKRGNDLIERGAG